MADLENNFCDLCEKGDCIGPIKLAHKPYVFHFYHSNQYKQALDDFQSRLTQEENSSINDDDSLNEDESDPDLENEEQVEDDELIIEENDEENRPLIDDSEDDDDDKEEEEEEEPEEEQEVEQEEEEEEEDEEEGNIEAAEIIETEEETETQTDKHIIPTSALTSIVSDVNTLMCKTIDVTMAAGVGIMAGIVSMTSGNSPSASSTASFFDMETVSKTCLGTALAVIGIVAGGKEIINAVNEKPPRLPICEYCNQCELEQPGCKIFCESCGDCDEGMYWKDGDESMHCLRICNDCHTNCVICEDNIATIKRHHNAFTINVHGKISTRLDGTFRDARIFGSSLIIAGILTCVVPGISWAWGIGLIAGSVIANSGIRIVAKPVVIIRCDSCNLEDEAGKFEESIGCQVWCQCCGVQEGTGGERYCMALCENCSQE